MPAKRKARKTTGTVVEDSAAGRTAGDDDLRAAEAAEDGVPSASAGVSTRSSNRRSNRLPSRGTDQRTRCDQSSDIFRRELHIFRNVNLAKK